MRVSGFRRALEKTSGNAQQYSDSFGIEGTSITPRRREEQLQQQQGLYKYPPPPPTATTATTATASTTPVSANVDEDPYLDDRLRVKRQRRDPPSSARETPVPVGTRKRGYLQSQKYLEYRSRPRRDTGKDGDPVWSDALEDAFQRGV